MKKKVSSIFAGLVLAALAVFLAAEGAEAFCFYNRTDTKIKVHQYGGGRKYSSFSAELNPGEKACCNWTNKDCNKKGKRDSTLYFNVQKEEKMHTNENICLVTIHAGGYVLVTGKNGIYRCEGHNE